VTLLTVVLVPFEVAEGLRGLDAAAEGLLITVSPVLLLEVLLS
jgi:hypothetical protein